MSRPPDILRGASRLVRSAAIDTPDPGAAADLIAALGDEEFAHIFLFVTYTPDFDAFMAAAADVAGPAISGCTTSGEITPNGYGDNGAVAVGLPASHFAVRSVAIRDIDHMDPVATVNELLDARYALSNDHPDWPSEFGMGFVDGMSQGAEYMLRQTAPGLASLPFFGGSAGDQLEFERTRVGLGGMGWDDGAVISLIRCRCPIKVFSLDHFQPTDRRLVVTRAEPAKRIVHEINAAPAAQEYARMLGLDETQLSNTVFASHPMVVRFGDMHYVRSIMRLGPDSTLEMASAIDEGMVLSLAEPTDIARHLSDGLADLGAEREPDAILAFDCLWRRISVEERQMTSQVSKILRDNKVVGFSTYGEQINHMHVNQTMTGVAIYPG